jgi:ankyrin repeat protein
MMALGHQLDFDDEAGLETLLTLGGDPNGPSPFTNGPLHQAVFRDRHLRTVELLRRFGADPDQPTRNGRTAYALAARSGRRTIMDWHVSAGASTALEPVDAFLAACAAGDQAEARRRLAMSPTLWPGLTDRDRAEICEAAAAGRTVAVETMIDVGWDVDTRGVVWGETPAHRAAHEGQLETFRRLVARGADLTILDRQYCCTPLAWAFHAERSEIVAFVRTLPERLDVWDAVELGLVDRVRTLLPSTDVNGGYRTCEPGVLLRLAVANGHAAVVDELLAHGADPRLRTEYDMNAIDVARERGASDLVGRLERVAAGRT